MYVGLKLNENGRLAGTINQLGAEVTLTRVWQWAVVEGIDEHVPILEPSRAKFWVATGEESKCSRRAFNGIVAPRPKHALVGGITRAPGSWKPIVEGLLPKRVNHIIGKQIQ